MVSESDFIAAFQAYHDALEDPAAKVETIRPLVNDHLEQLIGRLPGVTVQNAARQRAMAELDRIESLAKEKAVDLAEDIEEFEEEVKTKIPAPTQTTIFVEPENSEVGTPFTVGFSGSSGSPQAWIGIYASGAPHAEHGSNWAYVSGTQQPGEGKTAGSVTFSGDQYPAGSYDARLFRDNGHEMMASVTFTISAPPEPEPELEPAPEAEPETVMTSSGRSIGDVASHLDTLKLFGDKRRYIESLSEEIFDFTLKIEKMEKTIGIRLTDEFRGGNTCIGTIDEIGVGVRMPNTMELTLGQEIYVEAKLLEYRSVVKRFEFEHL